MLDSPVALVGHPFMPIGTGHALRTVFSSLRSVGVPVKVRDVWHFQAPEPAQVAMLVPVVTESYGAINIYHLNGDEVENALEHLGPLPPGRNIIYPMWELPRYPSVWARQLERFDEVWAASAFIERSISQEVDCPVLHMPLATEISLDRFFNRRYFGIPEGAFTFLFSFDCRSYIARKNPQAVVACFRRLLAARPWAQVCLVMKLHGRETAPVEIQEFLDSVDDLRRHAVILTETMEENEVYNLMRCSDAFVSLHRSEGYGLGLAEAMYLGRPVIATGYSGNMDFMASDNARLVDYTLIDVPSGAYPHAEGQRWADPDLDSATAHMIALIDDPGAARDLGRRGSLSIRTGFSYRAVGLRYANRLASAEPDVGRMACLTSRPAT
jgi:glycosyltransferase involved in cell wall biosynthesis